MVNKGKQDVILDVRPIESDADLLSLVKILIHEDVLGNGYTPVESILKSAIDRLIRPGVLRLGFYDGAKLAGGTWGEALTSITVQLHIAVLPEYRGKPLVGVAPKAFQALRAMGAQKLLGLIPAFNRRANFFMKMVGFRTEGLSSEAIMKDGELHNLVIWGKRLGEER